MQTRPLAFLARLTLVLIGSGSALTLAQQPVGAQLYTERCAICHEQAVERAPRTSTLKMMAPRSVISAMDGGLMALQSEGLSAEQKLDLVEYLFGSRVIPEPPPLPMCEAGLQLARERAPLQGWGLETGNSRFVSAATGGLTASDLPNLKTRWVFAMPEQDRSRSQPAVVGGLVLIGSGDGTVYALDEETGCVHWTYRAPIEVRTGITVVGWEEGSRLPRPLAVFGDLAGRVHAVDLETGERAWLAYADDHPGAMITAQPQTFGDRVYVTVSSREYAFATELQYPCCTFRGSVVALDAATGTQVWKTYVIPAPAQPVGTSSIGVAQYAPSGAPIWNSVAIDPGRNRLYVATGENYQSPADDNSDAVFAMDLDNGSILWKWQSLAHDAWNLSCNDRANPDHPNCPAEDGPDYDFGAATLLVSTPRGDVVVAGQKSGDVFGLDPDTGELLWNNKVGMGGGKGGVHFGMAAEDSTVYVPINDGSRGDDPRPGIHAIDAATGQSLWSYVAEDRCDGRSGCLPGVSQAVTAIPGAVLAGHVDGMFRAYDRDTGSVLYELDTAVPWTGVGDIPGKGGSFSGGSGPVVYDGVLYLSSGYTMGYMPGNVLIALELE